MLKIVNRARTAALMAIFATAWIPDQALAQLLPPLPVGSLIVTMTSPASGSTVGGTVPVSASVSIVGALTVSSVQFQLDGANLGARDTSAPYSVSWDTTAAGDGSHTLTAVARDLFGVQYASAPVTVTVNNAPPPPADTTPPTVSITFPASGATISGTVSVTADASDNVGVVGVQFLLDNGVNGSADTTTAPYSVSWNTATANDGSHTITAIARDAAGNRTTSAPVTVTVANNAPPPPPPPPGSGGRFEETSSSVSYTPNTGWTRDGGRSWSGGGAALSTMPGAQATFTFTGTSVTWIGARFTGTGIARISVDGTFLREVDTYSKTEEVRVPMFTASGLANTTHTLTIEVTGRKNPAATDSFIFVDAFDVPSVTFSRLQETDPNVTYSVANWIVGDNSRPWSAGTATLSNTPGARATFAFTGTGIRWIGARGTQTGIANVTLDGVALPPVDTYAPSEQIQAEVFAKTDLADGNHTLTIEVTGTQNAASSSPFIVVDAFEVTMSGMRHQDTDPAVVYGNGWIQDNRDKAYSEGATAESETVGAQATISFTGTGIRWIGARGPQTGIARVLLDGNVVADSMDTFALTEGPQYTNFFTSGLANTSHTLTIQVMGKNPLSTNAWILIDAFDVIP